MQELLPGLFHWTATHPGHGATQNSYFYAPAGLLIDPRDVDGVLDQLPSQPTAIVLTTGHHLRDSSQIAGAARRTRGVASDRPGPRLT